MQSLHPRRPTKRTTPELPPPQNTSILIAGFSYARLSPLYCPHRQWLVNPTSKPSPLTYVPANTSFSSPNSPTHSPPPTPPPISNIAHPVTSPPISGSVSNAATSPVAENNLA